MPSVTEKEYTRLAINIKLFIEYNKFPFYFVYHMHMYVCILFKFSLHIYFRNTTVYSTNYFIFENFQCFGNIDFLSFGCRCFSKSFWTSTQNSDLSKSIPVYFIRVNSCKGNEFFFCYTLLSIVFEIWN